MIRKDMTEVERQEYCRKVVQDQMESGQTVNRWCKENGIPRARFYRYKRYVEGLGTNGSGAGEKSEEQEAAVKEQITIELPGIRIVVDGEADKGAVCRIVGALRPEC